MQEGLCAGDAGLALFGVILRAGLGLYIKARIG